MVRGFPPPVSATARVLPAVTFNVSPFAAHAGRARKNRTTASLPRTRLAPAPLNVLVPTPWLTADA